MKFSFMDKNVIICYKVVLFGSLLKAYHNKIKRALEIDL